MSWINVLIKPKETFEKEKANASFLKGFVNLVTAAIIFVFLSGFLMLFPGPNFSWIFTTPILFRELTLFLTFLLPSLLFFYLVFFILNKLVKGKATIKDQFYLSTLFISPLIIIITIINSFLGRTQLYAGTVLIAVLFILYCVHLSSKIIFDAFEPKPRIFTGIKIITEITIFLIITIAITYFYAITFLMQVIDFV